MRAVSPERWRGPTRLGVAAVFLAAATTLTGCGGLPARAAHTMPSDGQYSLLQEPQASYAPIRALIERAAKSVRMTMYLLADPAIEQALVDAHRQRGVAGRLRILTKTLARRDFSGFLDVLVPWSASRRWASCSRVRRVRVYRA